MDIVFERFYLANTPTDNKIKEAKFLGDPFYGSRMSENTIFIHYSS